ncbi:MAG: hypothetical protein APU95_05365 [Hadesarchaea archaeon YNP_N21]|nr:MAG: hypothetical protein APU95_05365 [Hadesarchaea archaeon YNP_N21]
MGELRLDAFAYTPLLPPLAELRAVVGEDCPRFAVKALKRADDPLSCRLAVKALTEQHIPAVIVNADQEAQA